MLSRIIAGTGCVLACLTVPAHETLASRSSSPPPPSTSPVTTVSPVAPPPPAAPEAPPPSPPAEPPPPSPPPEASPPANPSTAPESPSRVGQQIEAPPDTRTFGGVVADPVLPPRPVAAPSSVGAPVRLPYTGPGGVALPLAGASLALGGLALVAGQSARPRRRSERAA